MKVILKSLNTVIKVVPFKLPALGVYTVSAQHTSIPNPMSFKSDADTGNKSDAVTTSYPHEDAAQMGRLQTERSYKEWNDYWNAVRLDKTASVIEVTEGTKFDWKSSTYEGDNKENGGRDGSATDGKTQRWVFALRHGERVDLTYGAWVTYCFDSNGTYTRKDLNMPEKLSDRVGGSGSYARDTPLTRVGELQARLVGEGLRAAGVRLTHVYSSSALRSVATAHHLLLGLEADPSVKIRVEPGLFEYKAWYAVKGIAPFMTPQELQNAGYNVDLDYQPYVKLSRKADETLEQYYKRSELVMQSAVKDSEATGGNILFVGHATTLDIMVTALKQLEENSKPVTYAISPKLYRVPYCALAAVRGPPWTTVAPPCPPCANTSSGRFDWRSLLDI